MAYQANKPQPGDQLSVSQADLFNNFAAINTFVGVDHYGFGTANAGQHNFNQLAAPAVADATHVGIYCAVLNGKPELYINKAAPAVQVPFTASLKSATGWSWLPSGILMKWGNYNAVHNTTTTITFSVGATIPAFTVSPIVVLTPTSTGTDTIYISSISSFSFTVFNNAPHNDKTFNYIALGY
jgi:hypothetical protein